MSWLEDLGKAVAESPVGGVLTYVGERKHGQMLLARNRRDVQRVPDHFPSQGRDRQQGGNDHGHGRRQHDRGPKRAAQPRRKTAPTPARLVGRQIPEGSCGCEAQRPWDILQVGDELRSGLIARRGVLREAARDRCEELRREVRPQLGERAKFVVDDGVEGRSVGAPAERQPAGDHLVDHNAERPEVGAVVNAQPVHASAFCMTAAVLSTHTIPESYVVLNEVPKLPHACVVAEAEGIAAQVSLGRHPAVLIENEGALVVGRDVLDAFDRLEVLEATAEALVLSRPLGPLVPMPDAAIDELRRVFGVP